MKNSLVRWTDRVLPTKPPTPVTIFILSLVWPTNASLEIAGLFLPMYRIVALIVLPLAITRLISARVKFSFPDWCIIGFSVLQGVSLLTHYSLEETIRILQVNGSVIKTNILVNAGSTFVDSLGPYFIARAYLRSPQQVAATARLFIIVTLCVGLTALVEALTGQSLFLQTIRYDVRMGFQRASGPFPHPILWGIFAASTFAFTLCRGLIGQTALNRVGYAVLVFLAIITSVSSSALAAVAIQLLLLAWLHYSYGLAGRWMYFAGACTIIWLLVGLLSNRTPLEVFFYYGALNPSTGYFRVLIWQYGWADFLAVPWTGIGYQDWNRPIWLGSSIDNFWLVMLLRYGLVGTLPLALGVVAVIGAVFRPSKRLQETYQVSLANCWVAAVGSLAIIGFTVHYWLQNFQELFFLMGMWSALIRHSIHASANVTAHRPPLRAALTTRLRTSIPFFSE